MKGVAQSMARTRQPRGRARARIVDVAERAGVSPTTVSYVLNNRPHVTIPEETRARVWEAARELGYSANPLARAMRTGRTHMVGIAISALRQPFSVMLVQSLQECAANDGWAALIMDRGYGPSAMDVRSEAFRLWPVDGIIAQASDDWVRAFLAANGSDPLPFVHVDEGRPVDGTDHVRFDLRAGAVEAVEHLMQQGCRDVAFLAPRHQTGPGEARYDAYVEVMGNAGLEPQILLCERNDRVSARETTVKAARGDRCPGGLFCYNDDLALGACRGLREAGRHIPSDTAVVGVDDLPESAFAWPSLSTVQIPVPEIARTAWEFLHDRLATPDGPPRRAFFRSKLVVRESSGSRNAMG